MAIYTTFFLCKPAELAAGFPGWRPPLARPVRREFRNPFTGETTVVESREPIWEEGADEGPDRDYEVVAIEGHYEDYLEARLPPFVRACPHWAAKGLTDLELDPLLGAAGVKESLEYALYAPPSLGAFLQRLPPRFLARLRSIDLDAVAEKWAEVMSGPEFSHSVSGERLSDGWTTADALAILLPLSALARTGTAGQRMYLLTEA